MASAAVLGESMGGYVVVQMALQYPDRVERLRRTFESREEYHDFWRAHPAFSDEPWTAYLEDYFDADLVGSPPALRSRVAEAAVMADGRDQLNNPDLSRFRELDCPISLVRAPRNLLGEPSPLFPDEVVEQVRADLPQLVDRMVSDVNHYTLFLSARGADAIAASVIEAM